MSTDDPFIPPKKKLNIAWWIGGAILLLFCLFLFQLVGPSPAIVVSKQTTFITDPLLPSGLPNYEEHLRRQLSAGVTTENNAAVLLFEALWPSELDPSQYKAVARELGLKEVPSADYAMKSVHGKANRKRVAAWMPKASQDQIDSGIEPDVDAVINAALEHPWTSEQIPPLAEWLKENEEPLDLIVEASQRPRYYSPSPTFLDDKQDSLISFLLPGAQAVRDGVRGVNLRAMHRIGEKQFNEAWQDILAIYRLSTLVAQGPTLVEQMVAVALRSIALRSTDSLLSSDQLPKELTRQIQKDLATVQPFNNTANSVDRMERLLGLDAVIQMKLHGVSQLANIDGNQAESSPVDYLSIDWNVALLKLNQAYDEATAAMKLPPGSARRQALRQFENKLSADQQSLGTPGRMLGAILSRGSRSDLAGSMIQTRVLPALTAAIGAEERSNSMLALAQVAAALAAYRTEHGQYPDKLDELVPTTLAALPVDIFNSKPLIFQRIDNGYLLYSLGANGQDDHGSSSREQVFEGHPTNDSDSPETATMRGKIPGDADDYAIRLPTTPFEMPKPRTE